VYPPRDEHDERPVAARDRPLYDRAVVGCARHHGDPALELSELADALLAAHADHLIPPIQRVLDHVPAELPGRADDADPHLVHSAMPADKVTKPPEQLNQGPDSAGRRRTDSTLAPAEPIGGRPPRRRIVSSTS
jgi:hypothetical protein